MGASDHFAAPARTRIDRCPGVSRPWIADDGALVRLRVPGGRWNRVHELIEVAEAFGDGAVHLTSRSNVQIRGIEHNATCVPDAFIEAVRSLGFLPSISHELVRNIMMSPLSGVLGGRADLRPIAAQLDDALCREPRLAALSGRFLFVLDDGRGDIAHRRLDLGIVAVSSTRAQLRFGSEGWGEVSSLNKVTDRLIELALRFAEERGTGPAAAWHVDELNRPLAPPMEPDPRVRVRSDPPAFGWLSQDNGKSAHHIQVPDGRVTSEFATDLPGSVIVTPWQSVVVPYTEPA